MVTMYARSCVALEQALEFLMKAILLEYGVAYDKTHDILELLELLRSVNFHFAQEDSLELLAATITDWEESSRYGKGIRTSIQTVQRVHKFVCNLYVK